MDNEFYNWEIDVEGTGGTETLLFSNQRYVPTSGTYEGESYLATWTLDSFNRWVVSSRGLRQDDQGLIFPVGPVYNESTPLDFNNRLKPDGTRELAYLFDGTYTFTGDVRCRYAYADSTAPPVEADFSTIYTGKLARDPERIVSSDGESHTVRFFIAPVTADIKGPLLTEKFFGSGGWAQMNPPVGGYLAPSAPPIGADWTLQIYCNSDYTSPDTNKQHYLTFLDSGDNILISLYKNSDDELCLEVENGAGLDQYVLYDGMTGSSWTDMEDFTVVWSETAGTYDVYHRDELIVDAATITNNRSGTISKFRVMNSLATLIRYRASYFRVYAKALSGQEVLDTIGPLEPEEDLLLRAAYEFDERNGTTFIDNSGKARHLDATGTTITWGSNAEDFVNEIDGDADLAGKVIPLALGDFFSVPLTPLDARLNRYMISVAGDIPRYARVHGVALVSDYAPGFGFVRFDGPNATIDSVALGEFGHRWVQNQRIEVLTGDFQGIHKIRSIYPHPYRYVRSIGSVDFNFTALLEESPSANVTTTTDQITIPSEDPNWGVNDSIQSPYETSGLSSKFLHANRFYPLPFFCDGVGDTEILSSGSPSGYQPPSALDNVLLQLVRKYGPKWDSTTYPTTVYNSLNRRVGYYIDDDRPADDVVRDLTSSCLVWLLEDRNGVIRPKSFQFVDEAPAATKTITAGSVLSVSDTRIAGAAMTSGRDITAVKVRYAVSETQIDAAQIPPVVDRQTSNYLSTGAREVIAGDQSIRNRRTAVFTTREIRKTRARPIGERLISLAQSRIIDVSFKEEALEMFTDYAHGDKINLDLSDFGVEQAAGVIAGIQRSPTRGEMTVTVVLGNAPS